MTWVFYNNLLYDQIIEMIKLCVGNPIDSIIPYVGYDLGLLLLFYCMIKSLKGLDWMFENKLIDSSLNGL